LLATQVRFAHLLCSQGDKAVGFFKLAINFPKEFL
jgi:hypothetical protein